MKVLKNADLINLNISLENNRRKTVNSESQKVLNQKYRNNAINSKKNLLNLKVKLKSNQRIIKEINSEKMINFSNIFSKRITKSVKVLNRNEKKQIFHNMNNNKESSHLWTKSKNSTPFKFDNEIKLTDLRNYTINPLISKNTNIEKPNKYYNLKNKKEKQTSKFIVKNTKSKRMLFHHKMLKEEKCNKYLNKTTRPQSNLKIYELKKSRNMMNNENYEHSINLKTFTNYTYKKDEMKTNKMTEENTKIVKCNENVKDKIESQDLTMSAFWLS